MRELQGSAGLLVAVLLACGGGGGGGGGTKCSGGLTACLGACVDVKTDAAHCGGCLGHACPTGATCEAGACRCPEGQTPCDGACVDLQASKDDCGACGHACGLGTCQARGCVCDASPATVASCTSASPQCVDTSGDPANCGGCGHACATEKPGSTCSGGTCQCLDPRPDACGAGCTNLQTDAANCQTCGHACPLTNEVCVGGACQCPADKPTPCGSSPGTCVSLASDAANCGGCGHACPADATCSFSACHCPAAKPDLCTGTNTCVDKSSDASNCGGCGNACPTGATCRTAKCACPAEKPITCGSTPGRCCAGTGCCTGGACQTAHDNGLGQPYYDCSALDQWTESQAMAAAQAFAPGGTPVPSPNCISCICAVNGDQTGVWCYAGGPDPSLVGKMGVWPVSTCYAVPGCPTPTQPEVHDWR